MNSPLVCLLVGGVCLFGGYAHSAPAEVTGANVDESKVTHTYYVDPSNADSVDDGDHGTEEAPFKTVGRALRAACADQDRGIGAKVLLADGVYRETVHAPAPTHDPGDAPLVIEATNREQAIVDGADTVGWEAGSWKATGANLVHDWPDAPPQAREGEKKGATTPGCKPLPGNVLVFVNGQAFPQAPDFTTQPVGAFSVAFSPSAAEAKGRHPRSAAAPVSPAAGAIFIRPADGEEMGGGPIEVSVREGAFVIEGRRNVVIRGITVQHVAGGMDWGSNGALELRGCSNVLIDDVLCQWNLDTGLRIVGRTSAPWSAGVTLRRVRLLYNGGSGLAAADLKNLAVEDSETSFNGVRGKWADCIDPTAAAGSKASGIHGGAWRRHHAVGNSARGLWWAGDCTDITVEDAFSRANLVSGMFIEASAGPFVIRHCVVAATKTHHSVRGDVACPAGVSICAAADVRLEDNIIADNEMPQLSVWDVAQRGDVPNFESGVRETHRSERHVYHQNIFWGADADQPVFSLPMTDRATKAPFDFYYGTLDVDGNCYWNAAQPEVFCSFDKGNNRRPGIDLAGWKTFLASRAGVGKTPPEATSIWADPLFTDPAEGDFWLRAGSPAADWGMPSDEGSVAQ